VSDPALAIIKYVFLALLYLFFLRVIRAVWAEIREPRLITAAELEHPPPSPFEVGRGRAQRWDLVVTAPDELRGQTFPVDDEVTVGRSPGCGISLPSDSFASNMHARVFQRDGDVWVEDLGSTNGTLLNGHRVAGAVPLRRGDSIQVGRTTLQLRS
jgi:hypothetical protein